MFFFQFIFFQFICYCFSHEIFLLKLISLNQKRALNILLFLYFLFWLIYLDQTRFAIFLFIFPAVFLIIFLIFLKKQEQKKTLLKLYSLLIPLESQMKLGFSFINSWENSFKDFESGKIKRKFQEITEILKFQKSFSYSDKRIENFVKDLLLIHASQNPLKRFQQLQKKIKVEQHFQIKSKRVLLQIRIQTYILSVFYLGLLAWTIISYGTKYINLILLSACFFCIALFWIIKTGRTMKWSI